VSKKRGRSKQQPVQVQAVPEEVLAEGSGPVADEAPSIIEVAPDNALDEVLTEGAGDQLALEASGDEATAIEDASTELSADDLPGDDAEPSVDDANAADVDRELAAEGEGEAAAMPITASTMDPNTLKQLVEALVFAADKPITVQRLRQLTRVSDVTRLEQALAQITEDYAERGLVLQQVSGGFQFRTRPQFSAWVQQLIAGRPVRLSRAQLETLAIIAYRQPITRPEIDDIRGVDSSATLKLLMDRLLIRVLGKKEEAGRPMLYGTTREFLDFFSLGDLRELPTLREYSELSDESRKVMSNRLGLEPGGGDGDGGGGEGGGGGDGGEGGGGEGSGGGDGGGSSGLGGGGDLDNGGDAGGEQISARSLSDLAEQVLARDEAASAEETTMFSESISVDAETREVTPIVVEQAASDELEAEADADDVETRDLDPVTETMTLGDLPDLDSSATRIVDPLIAAEALAHAETIVSSGESPE